MVRATLARGKAFTDKLLAARARAPSGSPGFDQLCAELGTELGIKHRLTPPKSPQSETDPETVRASVFPANRMVERCNGRISDVLKPNHFNSALDLEQTLMRHAHLDNTQLPQSALGSKTPMQAIKDWHKSHPHLFGKSPRHHPGRDTYRFEKPPQRPPTSP